MNIDGVIDGIAKKPRELETVNKRIMKKTYITLCIKEKNNAIKSRTKI